MCQSRRKADPVWQNRTMSRGGRWEDKMVRLGARGRGKRWREDERKVSGRDWKRGNRKGEERK